MSKDRPSRPGRQGGAGNAGTSGRGPARTPVPAARKTDRAAAVKKTPVRRVQTRTDARRRKKPGLEDGLQAALTASLCIFVAAVFAFLAFVVVPAAGPVEGGIKGLVPEEDTGRAAPERRNPGGEDPVLVTVEPPPEIPVPRPPQAAPAPARQDSPAQTRPAETARPSAPRVETPARSRPEETRPAETARPSAPQVETPARSRPEETRPAETARPSAPRVETPARGQTPAAPPRPEPAPSGQGTLVFVIDDAGNNLVELEPFLRFPGPLTIAVLPGLPWSVEAARRIRAAGKEVILHQPMEAVGGQNPGPCALFVSMSAAEMRRIINRNIDEIGPVAGLNNHQGSLVTQNEAAMETVLSVCRERGIYFLDSRTISATAAPEAARSLSMRIGSRDVFLDNKQDRAAMSDSLDEGLYRARRDGSAVMIGHTWSPDLAGLLQDRYDALVRQGYTVTTVSQLLGRGR